MSIELVCMGTVGSYYLCHCYLFIKTLIDEHFDYLKKEHINITQEAEQLIESTRINLHENRVISLPEINFPTKKMDVSVYEKMKKSRYKPSQSYISRNETNMLDVLYEEV